MKHPGALHACWQLSSSWECTLKNTAARQVLLRAHLAGGPKPRRGEVPAAQGLTASSLHGSDIYSCGVSLHPSIGAAAVQAIPGFSPSRSFSPLLLAQLVKYPCLAHPPWLFSSFSFALKNKTSPQNPKTKPFSFTANGKPK